MSGSPHDSGLSAGTLSTRKVRPKPGLCLRDETQTRLVLRVKSVGTIKDIPRKCKQKQGRIRNTSIRQQEVNRKRRASSVF